MPTQPYVEINGAAANIAFRSPLSFSSSASAPSQADCTIVQTVWSAVPVVGQTFKIFRRDSVCVFSGTISEVDWKGLSEGSAAIEVTVHAVGLDDRLFRRTTWNRLGRGSGDYRCAQYRSWTSVVDTAGATVTWVSGDKFGPDLAAKVVSINGSPYTVTSVDSPDQITLSSSAGTHSSYSFMYTVYSGDVVKDLLDTYCDFEGFTYWSGASTINAGAPLDSLGVRFDPPVPVKDAIGLLLNANPTFAFWVDVNQVAYFGPRTLVAAPADFTPASGKQKRGVVVHRSREDVRNVEISTTTWDAILPRQEVIMGDGTSKSWFLTFPYRFSEVVSADLNGVPVTIADGSDPAAVADFYFITGEPIIWQDPAGVVLAGPSPGPADVLTINYKAVADNLIEYVDTSSTLGSGGTADRAATEGSGLGRYEQSVDRTALSGKTAALAEATAQVTRLKGDLIKIDLNTFEKGYAVGQVLAVTMAKLGLSAVSMFIDAVAASNSGCQGTTKDFEYTLTMIASTRRIMPEDVLGRLFNFGPQSGGSGGGGVVSTGGGGGGGTILTLNVLVTSGSFPITPPAVVQDALLLVRIKQDATGHGIVWDAAFEYPPPFIEALPNLKSNMIFMGDSSKWVLMGVPILNQ